MGFWQWLSGTGPPPNHGGELRNANDPVDAPGTVGPPSWRAGDDDLVALELPRTFSRSLPWPHPSPWSGWPGQWNTPHFNTQLGLSRLVDTAWACLDLNSSVLAAMPVYRSERGRVLPPVPWMTNPDPTIYTSWSEFAKQLFWDYGGLGEAFVLPMAHNDVGLPIRFRVVPPWLINVEMRSGTREYRLGGMDVTSDILHVRYMSDTANAHGVGPLEASGARMTAAMLLQRYVEKIAETGGTPFYWMELQRRLSPGEASDLLDRWVESRQRHAGEPAIVSGGAKLSQAHNMSAREMALLEIAQWTESRIAVLFGVPPFLVGLPASGGSSSGGSMTYANTEQLFSFHDRASLKPKAHQVMSALSGWALPHGQVAELNRDEYSRGTFSERASAYATLISAGVLAAEEVREMERFSGAQSSTALTGVSESPPRFVAPAQSTNGREPSERV